MPAAASSSGRKRPSLEKRKAPDYGLNFADQRFLAVFFIGFGAFFAGAFFFA